MGIVHCLLTFYKLHPNWKKTINRLFDNEVLTDIYPHRLIHSVFWLLNNQWSLILTQHWLFLNLPIDLETKKPALWDTESELIQCFISMMKCFPDITFDTLSSFQSVKKVDIKGNLAVCPHAPLSKEVRDHWSNKLIHIGADNDPIKKIRYKWDLMIDVKYTFVVIVTLKFSSVTAGCWLKFLCHKDSWPCVTLHKNDGNNAT